MAGKRILALDSQILDAIQKCSFYTFLNFVRNFKSNEPVLPMERGDLGHTMFESYYRDLQAGKDWNLAVERATIIGREHYQNLHLDLQTSEWVIKSFHEYAEYYKYDGMRILGVEEIFSFIIHEDEELIIVYEGKIDLHAELPNLGVTLFDHKFRAVRADYNGLDNQLIGYSIATNSNLVYINEVGLQKSYGPEKKFRRVPVPIGNGVKERWLKNTVMWAKILDHNLQNNVWPQSHLKTAPLGITQCVKCKFNRICNSENDEEMARKILEFYHIGEKWNVGRKEEGEVDTNGDETST